MNKNSQLALLLTAETINKKAGEKYYPRGEAYWKQGAVKSISEEDDGNTIVATVCGERDYTVKISARDGILSHQCSCPVGGRGSFCKHTVAAALAWLETRMGITIPVRAPAAGQNTEKKRFPRPPPPAAVPKPEKTSAPPLSPPPPAVSSPPEISPKTPPPTSPETPFSFLPPAEPSPDFIPARMLNEFVYCPRLFYYEHVDGVFVHSADTIEGKHQHEKIDSGKGGLPSAKKKKSAPASETEDAASANDAPPEIIHARSVELFSEELGVNAKLDLVEGESTPGGSLSLVPVEYKRGAPRQEEDGNQIWDADKMQLGLQILLLRHNGYICDRGILYYRATRQRVTLSLTDADILWIKERIAAARAAINAPIPPPLEDSPKCPRCSLAPVCLPDEIRFLSHITDAGSPLPSRVYQPELPLPGLPPATPENPATKFARMPFPENEISGDPFAFNVFQSPIPPFLPQLPSPDDPSLEKLPTPRFLTLKAPSNLRRLVAPSSETRALYLNTPGAYVSLKGARLVITEQGTTLDTCLLLDIHHIALFGPVQITTSVVQTCCEKEIPITYFSAGGRFYGITRGHTLPNVTTRIAQFAAAADPDKSLALARNFLHGKILNQKTLFMRNHEEPPKNMIYALKWLASAALIAKNTLTLLGIEGYAARIYFENFSGMLRSRDSDPDDNTANPVFSFYFKERNRRPPRDPVNAVLSLLYSLLAKDSALACLACGLDPYIGFLHQPRHGKPALALDLMEEFRPIIADSVTLTLFNNRMLNQNSFLQAGNAVALTHAARRTVFIAYEKRLSETITHPVFEYKVCYRRALELQARLLSKVLTGEIKEYIPLTTR